MDERIKEEMRSLRGKETLQSKQHCAGASERWVKNLWFARTNQKLFPIKSVRAYKESEEVKGRREKNKNTAAY